jgi:23S rRNA pseudouridine1911/1915/1917 synthase
MTHSTFKIQESDLDKRLDKILTEKFREHSRTYFQYLIDNGSVLINKNVPKKKDKLKIGDEVSVTLEAPLKTNLEPEEIPLEILYEDEHIIAINKPRGMCVHPGAGNPNHTLVNALLHHAETLSSGSSKQRPGIVHRLDKETSGVIIAAKTETAHKKLVDLFKERKMQKEYLAICENTPKEGIFSGAIGRHPVNRKEMCIREDGKEAITEITVLDKNERYSLVLLKPKTGRTHQLRVHLKALKAPIVGDKVYGNKNKMNSHMLLHAFKLKFIHPISMKLMELEAKIPKEFLFSLEK